MNTCTMKWLCGRSMAALALFAASWLPATTHAQDYPSKSITIVVPYGPGSATDNLVRPIAAALQKTLGQPVVVDNRPGANGLIAMQYGARAKPDGYTLLAGSTTTLAANLGLYKTLPYDPTKDFQPVAGMGSTSMMLMVRADHPAKDLKGLLALARTASNPLPVAYGNASAQIALALMSKVGGVKFAPIPYKGTPQALTDLLGGTVPAAIVDVGNGVPHIKSGKLTALVISGAARSVSAPDVPTLAETYPNTQLVTWIALVAPAGTPMAAVDKLHAAVDLALATPEVKRQLAGIATEVDPATPQEIGRRMERDLKLWLDLIRAAGIEPE